MMNIQMDQQASLPFSDQSEFVNVLVIGGGLAGIFASLAAAQDGARVVLIEPSNVLGGQGTAGGVAGFCGDTRLVNEPFEQLVNQLHVYGCIEPYNANADRRAYDLEACVYMLQEMVTSAGVEVLLHSRVIDAELENYKIRRVLASTAGQMIEFLPDMVIDASGVCVVAKSVGLPLMHEPKLKQLPMGLYFTLWDTNQKISPIYLDGMPVWKGDDDLPMTTLHVFPTGKVEVKMKVVGFDAADGKSLSEAEMHARRQMMGLIYHLQTKGYRGQILDQHVLAGVSRQIGIRESNRIIGQYILTEHDVTHGAVFEDAVAVGTYHLDYHWPECVERAGTGIITMVEPYHLPLRMMIPNGCVNMLVPGRSASGDQMAMSSYRVMATCAQMGYAAGHAASIACQSGGDVTTVDISVLQDKLRLHKQEINLSCYGEYLRQDIHRHEYLFEDDRPFASCHAPTLVQLSNNVYLVAWFAGTDEGHSDVRIWMANYMYGQWSVPRQLPTQHDQAHWNPVLHREDQKIYLFFKVGKDVETWQTWYCVSYDCGMTWSSPGELVAGDCGGRGPVKNKLICISDGSWLAPASLEQADRWVVFVDRSIDGGKTWQASECIAPCKRLCTGKGVIQPTLWESKNGHIHMLMRSTGGVIFRSDSDDSGQSWCDPYPIDMPNNNSGIDIAKLNDGTLALVCNPLASNHYDRNKRSPLSIFLSFDNGKSWPKRLDIESDDGEYSYPAVISTMTGVAIAYSWRRERIAFWLGSIESIMA